MNVPFEAGDHRTGIEVWELVCGQSGGRSRVADDKVDLVGGSSVDLHLNGLAGELADLDSLGANSTCGVGEGSDAQPQEVGAGVGALGLAGAVDGHGESVAAGVAAAGEGGLKLGDPAGGTVGSALGGVVGAAEPGEADDVGIDGGLFEDEGVAGGEGLDFGVGEGLVADVFDVAVGEVAPGDLGDEGGLAFEGLPSLNLGEVGPRRTRYGLRSDLLVPA